MRLEPGDDQLALADAVRSVLGDVVTSTSRRARRDGGSFERSTWSTLGELGVFGVVVTEAHGGLGLGAVELCLVMEAVGRSGLSAPVLETAAVVAPLLAEVSDDRRGLLDGLLGGGLVATSTLTGRSRLAADAMDADVIALVGRDVHLDMSGAFELRPQVSLDSSRRVCSVTPAGARSVVLPSEMSLDLEARIVVTNSALLLGIAAELLDQTVGYASERRQFGRPIGSFQALKHRLADVHVELEASRAAIWMAAVEYDERSDGSARSAAHLSTAHAAAAMITEAAELASDAALQIHGGIGYTWEHDLQIWLKQALVVGRRLGSAAFHRRRAAELAGLFVDVDTATGRARPVAFTPQEAVS